jgi:hypothetical protein
MLKYRMILINLRISKGSGNAFVSNSLECGLDMFDTRIHVTGILKECGPKEFGVKCLSTFELRKEEP